MSLASRPRLRRLRVSLAMSAALAVPPMIPLVPWWIEDAAAQSTPGEVETLRREVADLKRRDEENRARMVEMEKMLRQLLDAQSRGPAAPAPAPVAATPAAPASPASALDAALAAPPSGVAAQPAPTSAGSALDAALASSPSGQVTSSSAPVAMRGRDIWSTTFGGSNVAARLIDISALTNVAVGGSSVGDEDIGNLQGGAHDPNENGFTLQQFELAFSGAVDPFFTGFANVVFTPGAVELEEAFLTTSSLPFGMQVEGGYFLTEFGLINPTHAHAWEWVDQPVVNSRMFGGEGLRSPGARVGWLMPTPFFSELHFGVQNADLGSLTASFMSEQGIGGRPAVQRSVDNFNDLLWLGRWNASIDLAGLQGTSALMLGASVLYGPNGTGSDGDTWIYGADMKLRWRAPNNFRGWPFLIWQNEVIARDYQADWYLGGTAGGGGGGGHDHDHGGGEEEEEEPDFPNDLPADSLHDIGFYSQLLYGFRFRWAVGLRGEYATGDSPSIAEGVLSPRRDDPMRADRFRLSPLLIYQPTEFSRLRLQYNYDNTDTLGSQDAHTVWFAAEILYGAHGAHKY
ncbi:MAG: hypothetical protein ABR587_15175 [Candidatus Binatia bacterium]